MQDINYITKMVEKAMAQLQDKMMENFAKIPEGSMKDRCKAIMEELNKAMREGDTEKLDSLKKELVELQKANKNG
jgi:uncharacterized phage infection (PIP) family protein YhgE